MRNKTLGVVGGGVVGAATARAFAGFCEVKVYDVDPARRTHDLAEVVACGADGNGVVMLCLPTPARPDGACDTTAIEGFFADRVRYGETTVCYVLRSTVPVGFTRRCAEKYGLRNLVHSGEFLDARTATLNAQMPARNVIGVPGGVFDRSGESGFSVLEDLYRDRFPGVPIHCMTSDESEATKLGQNFLGACTVSLWNELQELCARSHCDFEVVRRAILADGRFSPAHSRVPGPDGLYGWGGACLGKDIRNFITCCEEAGGVSMMGRASKVRNDTHDRGRTA